jgi:hypothetical protein
MVVGMSDDGDDDGDDDDADAGGVGRILLLLSVVLSLTDAL